MSDFGPTRRRRRRARSTVAAAAALGMLLVVTGCSPDPDPLTSGEKGELCATLHDPVIFAAASAAYAPLDWAHRRYGPSVPGGSLLPTPDCTYLARGTRINRLEVFYFAPDESLADELIGALQSAGFVKSFRHWEQRDTNGHVSASAWLEQFYSASDADQEYRLYAELIGRPAIVISFTSRRF